MTHTPDISREGIDYQFGADAAKLANELRRMADDIDKGNSVIQSVRLMTNITLDDYTMTTFRMTYGVKREDPAKKPVCICAGFNGVNGFCPIHGGDKAVL